MDEKGKIYGLARFIFGKEHCFGWIKDKKFYGGMVNKQANNRPYNLGGQEDDYMNDAGRQDAEEQKENESDLLMSLKLNLDDSDSDDWSQ